MKIAVLVSGGVDSSVALQLLKEQGHDLTAFYLKIWLEDELEYLGQCPWQEDLTFVNQVCEQVGVPLEILNFQQAYFDKVVSYTIEEVRSGRTPNPDIMCNNQVKFGFFLDQIKDLDFDMVASGHYAQTTELEDGSLVLKQAPDPIKDQTYFLSNLKKDQLKKILFPIGHLAKPEVRKLAEEYNLANKNRKDSQGICFLGKFKFSQFIEHYLGKKTGDIIEQETNEKVGEHDGFWYYTIGQRRGIKLGGGPWFVAAKDIDKNIVYVSKNYHSPDKERKAFLVENLNWFPKQAPESFENLNFKLRHGPEFHQGNLSKNEDGQLKIILEENDQGIAPGQFVAFYQDDLCLGSGTMNIS